MSCLRLQCSQARAASAGDLEVCGVRFAADRPSPIIADSEELSSVAQNDIRSSFVTHDL